MSDVRPVDRPLICFVDDEPSILASLSAAIRSRGDFDVSTFDRAAAFLAFGLAASTRCLVTDHKMPGMTGVELLARVACLQPSAGRLLITGWSQAVSDAEIEALEIDAVIPKPWEDAELRDGIRKAIA